MTRTCTLLFFYQIQTHWVYNLALINIFGALFGMMTSFLLFRSKMQPKHEKEKVNKTTGLFAMFGESIQLLIFLNNLIPA